MKAFKDKKILGLILDFLKRIKHQGFPEYSYEKFRNIKAEQALNELETRLKNLRDLRERSKGNPQHYFFEEASWLYFLAELNLVEALNAYLILTKQKIPIPDLIMSDYDIEPVLMDIAGPFIKWTNECKILNVKP